MPTAAWTTVVSKRSRRRGRNKSVPTSMVSAHHAARVNHAPRPRRVISAPLPLEMKYPVRPQAERFTERRRAVSSPLPTEAKFHGGAARANTSSQARRPRSLTIFDMMVAGGKNKTLNEWAGSMKPMAEFQVDETLMPAEKKMHMGIQNMSIRYKVMRLMVERLDHDMRGSAFRGLRLTKIPLGEAIAVRTALAHSLKLFPAVRTMEEMQQRNTDLKVMAHGLIEFSEKGDFNKHVRSNKLYQAIRDYGYELGNAPEQLTVDDLENAEIQLLTAERHCDSSSAKRGTPDLMRDAASKMVTSDKHQYARRKNSRENNENAVRNRHEPERLLGSFG